MKYFHKNRLLKLAAFLDKLPKAKFNFGLLVNEAGKPMLEALAAGKHACGSVACAIGWMPAVFPRQVKWDSKENPQGIELIVRRESVPFRSAAQFFGISNDDARYLFNPGGSEDQATELDDDATPKQVAKHIRKFVEEAA